jgi:hypothetical protein
MKGDASVIVKANKVTRRGVDVTFAKEWLLLLRSEFNTKLVGQGSVEPGGQANASATRAGMGIEFNPKDSTDGELGLDEISNLSTSDAKGRVRGRGGEVIRDIENVEMGGHVERFLKMKKRKKSISIFFPR